MARLDYEQTFLDILAPLKVAAQAISRSDLFSHPRLDGVSESTKKSRLKAFLGANPDFVGVVQGVLPPPDTLLDLVERDLGQPISQSNVVLANRLSAQIVSRVTKPLLEEFVRSSLGDVINDNILTVDMDSLTEFLTGDFSVFMKGAGNGLVSVAGSLNEKLLARCLISSGMVEGVDYSVTGTESEGDILVHCHSGSRTNLGIEIKSYHARERLLRGLRDITRPKVGAGYFIDHYEFNQSRTKLLLQTQTAAIYMPSETLNRLSPVVIDMRTQDTVAYDSRFYRPLERFASDMQSYSATGLLPPA